MSVSDPALPAPGATSNVKMRSSRGPDDLKTGEEVIVQACLADRKADKLKSRPAKSLHCVEGATRCRTASALQTSND